MSYIFLGYGDMTPRHPATRVTAVLLGLIGVILTGIVVSLAVYATTKALDPVLTAAGAVH